MRLIHQKEHNRSKCAKNKEFRVVFVLSKEMLQEK